MRISDRHKPADLRAGRRWPVGIGVVAAALLLATTARSADPLPTWRDGAAKTRILGYVADVTTPGGRHYVTPIERVAVFDDDGTLWPEKPSPQGMFVLSRVRAVADRHPQWRDELPFRGVLELGQKYIQEASERNLAQLAAGASAGLTQDAWQQQVRQYFDDAVHPRYGVRYRQVGYQPMRELLAYLKGNGFRCFIVTGGSIEIARALALEVFGIPPDDVAGSSVVMTLREEDDALVMRRLATLHSVNEGDTRPLSIEMHFGQRPIIAVGNVGSGGDVRMLRYSQSQARPTLQLLIQHDDFAREYAYDEPDQASVKAASRHGWPLISMRYDWRRIFAFQSPAAAKRPPDAPP